MPGRHRGGAGFNALWRCMSLITTMLHPRIAVLHHSSSYLTSPCRTASPLQEPFVKLLSLFEGEAAKNNNKMIMDAVSKMPGSYSDPNPNPYPTETQTVALTLTQP